MANTNKILVQFIVIFYVFTLGRSIKINDDPKDYIVLLDSTSNKYSPTSQHVNVLQQVVQGRSAEETLIRSYKRSFNGFAAKLRPSEYENLKRNDEVLSIFPSRTLKVQTTRSWDFLGLPPPTPEQQTLESDVIIGVIDTGIWPESPSFNDDGLGPIPTKWKGVCNGGQNFTCNKKIIGARAYTGTARDTEGHGTHTASTAAGRITPDTSFYGIANGLARGGVPSSRIAVYSVCNSNGCSDSDILAAFDDAIADGVHVISISIGGGQPAQFYLDSVAIGAFHAMRNGIVTVQSAGNEDADTDITVSVAPWILSVAASNTDRRIIDKVVLGDGQTLIGNSVNSFTLEGNEFPVVYGKEASTMICSEDDAKNCTPECLDTNILKGKILVCDGNLGFENAFYAQPLGVLASTNSELAFVNPLPGAKLSQSQFSALKSYLNSTLFPKANILKSETIIDTTAPTVASFSLRGPNKIASDILKPDISAPGVDILAAYSPEAPVSGYPEDTRSVNYNIISGTSMACPHVAGAAAYIKSVHPDWSPAAIKSALMTTADPMSSTHELEAEFAYGSGHLNPVKALNPGLVYEASQIEYITFLCKFEGYDSTRIRTFTGNATIACPNPLPLPQSPKDVNYPSISVMVDANTPFTVTFNRTVINVGDVTSTYKAEVTSGSDIQVTVNPDSLFFGELKESKTFTVTVSGTLMNRLDPMSASLVWSDGVHSVRSPILVYTRE